MKKLLFVILFAIMVCYFACDKSPSGPKDEAVKGPRQFTWTVDTLAYPNTFQTTMGRIWGSSPRDVYTVGHSSVGAHGAMYHYDGETWKPINFHWG